MNLPESADFAGKRQHAALLLVAGFSIVQAAKQAGVGPRTIHNWLAKPEYRAYINRLRDGYVDEALGRLTTAATRAVDTLVGLLQSPTPSIRLRSATSILDLLIKIRGHKELIERIAGLEERCGLVDVGFEARPGDEPGGEHEIPALAGRIG